MRRRLAAAGALAWHAARREFAAAAACTAAAAVLPVVAAWFTRALIDVLAATEAGGPGRHGHPDVLGPVVGLACVGLALAVLPPVSRYLRAESDRAVGLAAQDGLFAAVDRCVGLAAMVVARRRGATAECHCFGRASGLSGPRHLVRNAFLGAAALAGVVASAAPAGPVRPAGLAATLAVAAVATLAVITFDELVELFAP